jgi:hypothetical protein
MRVCAVALAVIAGGCSTRFSYVPRESVAEKMSGRIAARYDLLSPPGTVRVAAIGSEVTPDRGRALKVRLAITNASDEPWTFDAREQVADLYSDSRFGATPVAPIAGASPIIQIPPRSERAIDLDYPLPPNLQKASHLPAFVLRWTVHSPDRTVAAATPFVRWPRLITRWNPTWFGPTQTSVGEWSGWYDPEYPQHTYVLSYRR